jgi:hypothetical protein
MIKALVKGVGPFSSLKMLLQIHRFTLTSKDKKKDCLAFEESKEKSQ